MCAENDRIHRSNSSIDKKIVARYILQNQFLSDGGFKENLWLNLIAQAYRIRVNLLYAALYYILPWTLVKKS